MDLASHLQRQDAHERLVSQEEKLLKTEKIKKKLGTGKEKKRIPKIGEWAIGYPPTNGTDELEAVNLDTTITPADFKKDKNVPERERSLSNGLGTTSLREIGGLMKRETPPNPLIRLSGTAKSLAKARTLPVLDCIYYPFNYLFCSILFPLLFDHLLDVPQSPAPPVASPVKRPFTPPFATSSSPSSSPSPVPGTQQRLPPLKKYVTPTLGEEHLSSFVDDDGLTHFFPLDFFDDYSFEVRAPEDWLKHGHVKASSKWFNSDGKWSWAPCIVESYNAAEGKFLIVWVESGKKKPVSRLNLLFDDEDKTNFQNRIEAAFQFRFYCETLLKRATRLEKKDLEKVPSLPSGIQKEIDI